MDMSIPDPALVLLIGPSGAGKSTFAQVHFSATEVISSDNLRAMLADDPADQGASAEAFDLLGSIATGRLRRRLTTVVDATNLRAASRRRFRRLADRHGVPTVAIVFAFEPRFYLAHNTLRDGRTVETGVVAAQAARMPAALAALPAEGYAALYVLREPELATSVSVQRVRSA